MNKEDLLNTTPSDSDNWNLGNYFAQARFELMDENINSNKTVAEIEESAKLLAIDTISNQSSDTSTFNFNLSDSDRYQCLDWGEAIMEDIANEQGINPREMRVKDYVSLSLLADYDKNRDKVKRILLKEKNKVSSKPSTVKVAHYKEQIYKVANLKHSEYYNR